MSHEKALIFQYPSQPRTNIVFRTNICYQITNVFDKIVLVTFADHKILKVKR